VVSKIKTITPNWDVPSHVNAYVTLRTGGFSQANYRGFNLATHVDDNIEHVKLNRQLLQNELELPSAPQWLEQTHSTQVVELSNSFSGQIIKADAAYTKLLDSVCVVMTADCLPLFLYHPEDKTVAVVHAGWRGLANGIIEKTIKKMTSTPEKMQVWLGPAIGPEKFEVGEEVRDIFCNVDTDAVECFKNSNLKNGKQHYLADIYRLATRRLYNMGVISVSGGDYCTMSDEQQFFSYRRDGETGRMASLIWLSEY